MIAKPSLGGYTHSEFLSEESDNLSESQKKRTERNKSEALIKAIKGIAEQGVDKKLTVELVLANFDDIFELTQHERVRRSGHHYKLSHALGSLGITHSFSPDPNDIARSALYTFTGFNEIKMRLHEDNVHYANGSPISAELGHVDQFGVWETTAALDQAIKQLPDTSAPDGSEPLEFEKIFGKDEGKRSYDLKEGNNSTLFVRMRPIADLRDSVGNKYEIVKRSSGLVRRNNLSDAQKSVLDEALAYKSSKESKKGDEKEKRLMKTVGDEIIDPFISSEDRYGDRPHLFPVSALYFVMLRNRSRAESPVTPE